MNEAAIRLSWPDFITELAVLTRTIPKVPKLYLVGGAARNVYLGRPIDELDIAVDGDAIALARYVTDAWNADIYIMDRERGVARVFVKRADGVMTIDFARFRGETLEDDLRDRDFTMNAMAADLLGDPLALIDPLDGAADLKARVLRRCSPQSIENDPIRVLRAVRLSAQFDLRIHPDTLTDMQKNIGGLRLSSPERIRDEFFKLLGIEKSARGLRVLAHMGALAIILRIDTSASDSALAAAERMSTVLTAISSKRTDNTAAAFDLGMLIIQLDRFRASLQAHLRQVYGNGRGHAELLMLAALLHATIDISARDRTSKAADKAREAAQSLRLTRDEERNLVAAVLNRHAVIERESWTTLDQHRFWHRLGEERH